MFDGIDHSLATRRERAGVAERLLLRALDAVLRGSGIELVLWDGSRAGDSGGQRIHVRDRGALWRLARDPNLQFGELYSEGRLEVEGDLVALLERGYRAVELGQGAHRILGWLWRDRAPRARSIAAARENIHHHYDLGNDFYAQWLDREAMQYTCAYFPEPGMSLEQAQRAKMHHICRKLRLQAGQQVFEAGCGWGGFALFMAREYGVRVRAWNISHEQVRYARERARAEGLADRVEYVEDDYRTIRGHCDAFVSVGMLEHVGPENYAALGAVIDRTLAPHGFGLIHTIGRNRPGRMNSWIERRIFPGAQPPSLSQMMAIFEPYGFSVLDVENLRLHYAETLRHWRARFHAVVENARATRGEAFVRAWDLYLAGAIASFTTGSLQLFQVLFARDAYNGLPASRRDLYL